MTRLIMEVLLWIIVAGFGTFCTLYVVWNRPWRDRMGRRVLIFMSILAWAFSYALFSRFLSRTLREDGWVVLLFAIAFAIWYSVYILIKYRLEANKINRRLESDKNNEEK